MKMDYFTQTDIERIAVEAFLMRLDRADYSVWDHPEVNHTITALDVLNELEEYTAKVKAKIIAGEI
jgi:hypothetical protein